MPHGKSKVEKKKNEHLTPKENRTSKENRNRIQPHGGYGGGGRATLALVLQKISRNHESTSIDSSDPANTRLCIDFLCCSKFVSLYRLFPCADYSDLHLPSFPFGLAFHSPLGRDLFRFSTWFRISAFRGSGQSTELLIFLQLLKSVFDSWLSLIRCFDFPAILDVPWILDLPLFFRVSRILITGGAGFCFFP